MTQENKELLLKDLCTRLPYRVKVRVTPVPKFNHIAYDAKLFNINTNNMFGVITDDNVKYIPHNIEQIKPYLFPLSNMTEGQKEFLRQQNWYIAISTSKTIETTIEGFDWLNKNHFDYRCLIEKGLAIDATGLNIY